MAAFYSVIQYVPDIIRGERINIGIVAFSETTGETRSHFIENWQRVRAFDDGATGLRHVVNIVRMMKLEDIKSAVQSWHQSVRFTEPKASLLDIDLLLVDASRRYLIDPEKPAKKPYRNRQDAVATTRRAVEGALREKIGKAAKTFLKSDYALKGRIERHEFDLALANGQPIVMADSLSFEVPLNKDLIKNVKVTEWAVKDIKDGNPNLPVAVVLLPPPEGSSEANVFFERVTKTLSVLGAETIVESGLKEWAEEQAGLVEDHIAKKIGRH